MSDQTALAKRGPGDSPLVQRAEGSAGQIEVAMTRAAQEVQAAMVMARRFPRDERAAYARIINACKRKSLAEQSQYAYPRGSSKVEGPTIRLAEAIAQNWGNLDSGIIELEQRNGESTMMAYCWDLETNNRQTKVFNVPHLRRKGDQNVRLHDPRDIYEMMANQGARRLRSCILACIPGDITEAAINQCNKTLAEGSKEPLGDRVRSMVAAFGEYNVKPGMIEGRLGHSLDSVSETELIALRKIYTSLKDNMAGVGDFFEQSRDASKSPAQNIVARERGKGKAGQLPEESKQPETETPQGDFTPFPEPEDPPEAQPATGSKAEPEPEPEPEPADESVPNISFDQIGTVAVGSKFATMAQVDKVEERAMQGSNKVYHWVWLFGGAADKIRATYWGSLPGWVKRNATAEIVAKRDKDYGKSMRITILEWNEVQQ